MKRFNHLFEQIITFDNILKAYHKASKGKKNKKSVASFSFQLEANLLKIKAGLEQKQYWPGAYRTFHIYDPKKRMISAAPFRDRVIHHALCNVIEPIFERRFIFDSYANRIGKGTHKAIERYQQFARKNKYVLKADIRKFFPSIDHEILKEKIRRKIKCKDTLWLVDLIIDHSNEQEEHLVWFKGDNILTPYERKKGLPIGNLTSQFWGNVYLNSFDHFVKDVLKVKAYIRYVDDFVLLSNNKEELWKWKSAVQEYLAGLRLITHPHKTQIHLSKKGIPFLGCRVFPHYRFIRKEKVRRYKRYLKKNLKKRNMKQISPEILESQINAWLGHIRFGHSKRLENSIFNYIRSQGVNLFKSPSGSWRV